MKHFEEKEHVHVLEISEEDVGSALRLLSTGRIPAFAYTPPRLFVVNETDFTLLKEHDIDFEHLKGAKASAALKNHHKKRKTVSKKWQEAVLANLLPGVGSK